MAARASLLGSVLVSLSVIACQKAESPAPTPPPETTPSTAAPVTAPPIVAPPSPPPATPPPALPRATATPKPAPVTPATPAPVASPVIDAARVASLVASGESALADGRLREARGFFDEALALDPDSAPARRGKARAATCERGLTRTLIPDIPSSEGVEGTLKQIDGFDDVEELNVKRAVKIPGRAELDAPTGHLKPGDVVNVSIYLKNQSKKKRNIKIDNVKVNRILNDKDNVLTVAWNPIEVRPKQRSLVATLTLPWDDDVSSWILAVKVLSENGDIYENRLVWK